MVDEHVILTVERLLGDLATAATDLRSRFKSADRPVRGGPVAGTIAKLAEIWMVEVAPRDDVRAALDPDDLADTTVHFQRLLTATEKATPRRTYEKEIRAIQRNSALRLVIPLKQHRGAAAPPPREEPDAEFAASAFLGHSFADEDAFVVTAVTDLLEGLGIKVVTGARPQAGSISEKVRKRIEEQNLFVGLFTRGDKLAGKTEWKTSEWVVDEKAYAFGQGKRLILLKEIGVTNIGGLQGDAEYIEFSRDRLDLLLVKILQLFAVSVDGLA